MDESSYTQMRQSMIDIAAEAWRFRRVFIKAMAKLDLNESSKYLNQYSWFTKKVDAALESAGLTVVNVEGQCYDTGMAVTPINLDDFEADEQLFVEQMLEPIIMDQQTVVKAGTVILGRPQA